MLSELSAIARHQGRLEESRQWAEQSLDLRVAHGLDTVRSLADLASLALAEDDLDRAEELLLQARGIFARDGQVRNVAVASRQLGEVERRRGDNEKAVEHVSDAVRGFAELGEGQSVGACLQDLARLAKERGELGRAAHLWAVGLALRDAGDAPEGNPLFPHEIGDLPELHADVRVDISLQEAVRLAITNID